MQHITLQQGDAVLDLMEQCTAVTQAWEQKQAHERTGGSAIEKAQRQAVATEVSETYKDAVTILTDLYVRADRLGVDDDILFGVLVKHLPTDISVTLNLGPAPSAA